MPFESTIAANDLIYGLESLVPLIVVVVVPRLETQASARLIAGISLRLKFGLLPLFLLLLFEVIFKSGGCIHQLLELCRSHHSELYLELGT